MNIKVEFLTNGSCGACKLMKPFIKNIKEVETIDIDEFPEYKTKYQLKALPTIVFIRDDLVRHIQEGFMTQEQIENKINDLKINE